MEYNGRCQMHEHNSLLQTQLDSSPSIWSRQEAEAASLTLPSQFSPLSSSFLQYAFLPLLDPLQKLDLFKVSAPAPILHELVGHIIWLGRNVRTPVHRGLVERRQLLCLVSRRGGERREGRAWFAWTRALWCWCSCGGGGRWRGVCGGRRRCRRHPGDAFPCSRRVWRS